MTKLTIVVNCTDRKSAVPTDDLRARTLPDGDDVTRFAVWQRRVLGAPRLTKLVNLYKGEAWLQAKALAEDANRAGHAVRMLVASAGLGLRDVTETAPPYAATFATRQPDSVTNDVRNLQNWWESLRGLGASITAERYASGPVLLVLSENYARAMDEHLQELACRGGNYLLVGGWRDINGLARLRSDRELRNILGGTASSLNLRMARRWLAHRSGPDLFSNRDMTKWSRWADTARQSETYDRTPMTDQEIKRLIRGLVQSNDDWSATKALRHLRDSGVACEQKRFGKLFLEEVMERE